MSRIAIVVSAALLALASTTGAYFYGHRQGTAQGTATERAQHNAQTVQNLSSLINAHQALISQANSASMALRTAQNKRAQQDQATTQEFKNALSVYAADRINCYFDATVMRQLSTAASRATQAATQAATNGLLEPLPSAPAINER